MTNTKTLRSLHGKSELKLTSTIGRKLLTYNLRVLMFTALLIISATVDGKAACQTPQFALPVVLTVNRPAAAAPGDFNGDGSVDLAILRNLQGGSFPGVVEIYLNNGSGTFTPTGIQYNALPVGGQILINDLAAADFNNDGKLDLVAVGTGSGTAAILLGNGNGGFSQPTNFSTAGNSTAAAVGDFNNDGNRDIITRGFSGVSILPGQGNGSFNSAIVIETGSGSSDSIALRDFNNDGFLDFVTVNTSSSSNASVRLGNGSFNFTSPPSINLPRPNNLTANDFNRDGRQDFAVVNRFGDGTVSVLLGVGDGNFNSPTGSPFSTGGNFSEYITSADLNSDNIPDLAVGNDSASNSLSILLNNGAGVFGTPFNLSPEQGSSTKIYPVDYDRSGTMDLVIVKEISQNKVVLLRNTCAPPNKARFDFDGDGKSDISVFRPSNGSWYLSQSQNGFTGVQFGVAADKLVPADYDGDGKTDIAVYRSGTWYLNRSQLGFTGFAFGDANDIPQPADFDGDGKTELAVFRPSNGVWYVYNLANNQFNSFQFGASTDRPAVGDYDGDGKADYAVYRAGIWYIQRSQLGFTGFAFGDAADKPVPADYDGDNKTDIAVFRPSNGVWYLQRSTAGFTSAQFGISTDLPAAADYDGDGKADIAVFRDGTWYLNRSLQGFTGVAFGAATDKPVPNAFVP